MLGEQQVDVLYLEGFEHTIAVMQTAAALERVAYEFMEDMARDNVVYAEVRFAPHFHTRAGLGLDAPAEQGIALPVDPRGERVLPAPSGDLFQDGAEVLGARVPVAVPQVELAQRAPPGLVVVHQHAEGLEHDGALRVDHARVGLAGAHALAAVQPRALAARARRAGGSARSPRG